MKLSLHRFPAEKVPVYPGLDAAESVSAQVPEAEATQAVHVYSLVSAGAEATVQEKETPYLLTIPGDNRIDGSTCRQCYIKDCGLPDKNYCPADRFV